jgi:long-chain acyl-CoA synthetase
MKRLHEDKGDTWPKVLRYNHETYGDDRKAMRHKHYGIWQPYTWRDYYLNVKSLALGLLSLGLEPGDKLLIVGDNAPQWYYAELAAQADHGVSVGVYSDSTAKEIEYVARNSEARFAIVEDQEQVDKLLDIKENLPLLKKVIYWDYKGLAHYDDPVLMGYGQVVALGEQCDRDQPGVFEQMVETGRADDVCALVYTSGATGAAPKAAVHTYRTMRASADFHLQLDPWHESDDVVPYLPPAAMTEQWSSVGCHLLSASILNFAEEPETQQRDTREIGPTIAVYDARLWEGQAAAVRARMVGIDALKRLVFHLLMPIGYRMADLRFQKKRSSAFLKLLYFLADVVLFKPVRASLGLSNVRICYSTGGILSPDALRFYHALNLTLKSVYGTTEGGVLTGARNDDIRLETVGRVCNGTEVRITDEGEIVYRGPGVFLGYYQDPDKSAAAAEDGWFHTGDSGLVTEDGQLLFLDRVRDLVKLANGDKLAPQFIESRLRSSPFIKDAWVVAGPDGAFVSAVIVINYETVGRWAGQRRVAYSTFAELSQKPEIYGLVNEEIERINSTLPAACRVRKYVNLHREFDPDEGELTRTRKLRKIVLRVRYRDLIDAIYGGKNEVLTEVRVRYPDGRVGTAKTSLTIKAIEGATE